MVRIEDVLNLDLLVKFLAARDEIRCRLQQLPLSELEACVPCKRLEKWRHEADYRQLLERRVLQTRPSFHGTKTAVVPLISRGGFLKLGSVNMTTGETVLKNAGSKYGSGIYVTPAAHLALVYNDWDPEEPPACPSASWIPVGVYRKRLIICATLLDRAANFRLDDGAWPEAAELTERADAHVANEG